MTLRRGIAVLLSVIAVAITGCGSSGKSGEVTLTVYSASGLGAWYRSQFAKFTERTGVAVTLFEAGSGEVVSRVNSRAVWERLDGEKSVPPADLLVTIPPFIQKAAKAGVLQPAGVDVAGLSAESRDPGGLFVPIVKTALCFIANPQAKPRPVTFEDLLRPGLKGKLQYSTPGEAGDGTALLLLLQHLMGKQGALDYFVRLNANNVGPSSSTSELQGKVDSGELLIANGDVQMNLASIRNDGSRFAIFFPAAGDGTRTTVSLPYVAGVTADTKSPEQAKELLSFLLSDAAQEAVAAEAHGIPARDAVAARMATGTSASPTAAGLLDGVRLWVPDWNAVLGELDADVAAYTRALGR
ncbi:MAG: 2-aminoethylphosphonate ABC transporter substrate-binding protein [Mycobacterium sp.]